MKFGLGCCWFHFNKEKEEGDGCFYNNNIIIIGTYYSQGAGVELLGRCANERTSERGVVVGRLLVRQGREV